ncbi:biotin--[acetyl-CoA-carboxylase] ligase [Canibacter sp. lx-45]|uniref:biotin--[acetyl-CoA-carboxylase] ligase n=1 Tax=Canibacter zhuwentaonis TaxID=2837491 RepID=UPI001BDC7383|nr:biotin--[acetyl-CoA-carboxylase] ligase [Canibacter zhuwentaonis]MBT1035431.1 biotin--[acetyl-CoA-carboxylase] ligase [Canibacter zhuwentaonis]
MIFDTVSRLVTTHYLSSCGSTNAEAFELARLQPVPAELLVVTADQRAGRGRMARNWSDTAGKSLAVSYFLPDHLFAAVNPTWVPLVAGYAMCGALKNLVAAQLKWPNDIILPLLDDVQDELARARGGAKLCGILCETAHNGIIIGAGLNMFTALPELVPGAISLAAAGAAEARHPDITAPGATALADKIIAQFVTGTRDALELVARDFEAFKREISVSTATINRRVRAELVSGEVLEGVAVELGDAGELLLQTDAGVLRAITSGEITHLRAARN